MASGADTRLLQVGLGAGGAGALIRGPPGRQPTTGKNKRNKATSTRSQEPGHDAVTTHLEESDVGAREVDCQRPGHRLAGLLPQDGGRHLLVAPFHDDGLAPLRHGKRLVRRRAHHVERVAKHHAAHYGERGAQAKAGLLERVGDCGWAPGGWATRRCEGSGGGASMGWFEKL